MVAHKNQNAKMSEVVVVGEQSLFLINPDDGKITYQRRFDFNPSCITVFHNPRGSEIYSGEKRDVSQIRRAKNSPCFSYLLGSFAGAILVFKDVQLVWTATTATPIFVDVREFEGTPGLVVGLGDDGFLQVSFLGTAPPQNALQLSHPKAVNYAQMDRDHQALLGQILAIERNERAEPTEALRAGFQVLGVEEVHEYLDDPRGQLMRGGNGFPIQVKVKASLSYNEATLNKLSLDVQAPQVSP